MSHRPRRLVAALIAGLALTVAPAVAGSATAAEEVQPVTNVRVDLAKPLEVGKVKITWDASPTPDLTTYIISAVGENGVPKNEGYQTNDRTFTFTDVNPGESLDVRVAATRFNGDTATATLRVTAIDNAAPNYAFTDTTANTFRYQIAWLSSTGITTGYENTNGSRFFAPSAPVLREQMAAFLYRYAQNLDVFTYTPPATSPFTDVPTTATFYKEIAWLNAQGISTGYAGPNGTKTFRPTQPVLREQMAAFLYRFDGTNFEAEGGSFTDVSASATFFDEIEWLASEGISTGYEGPNGTRTFRGSDAVLREQMAAFLYRYENGFFGDNTVIIDN